MLHFPFSVRFGKKSVAIQASRAAVNPAWPLDHLKTFY